MIGPDISSAQHQRTRHTDRVRSGATQSSQRRHRASICVCLTAAAMSSKKAVFKPGQSGKKVAARSSMDDTESDGAAASGRGGAKKKSLAQQIAELSNPTPKGACAERTAGSREQRDAGAWTVHSGTQDSRARSRALSVRIGARLTPVPLRTSSCAAAVRAVCRFRSGG